MTRRPARLGRWRCVACGSVWHPSPDPRQALAYHRAKHHPELPPLPHLPPAQET